MAKLTANPHIIEGTAILVEGMRKLIINVGKLKAR